MKMKARKLLSVIMASVLLASLFPFSAAALPDSEAETDGSVLPREQVMTDRGRYHTRLYQRGYGHF